jgi:hypothetical protein
MSHAHRMNRPVYEERGRDITPRGLASSLGVFPDDASLIPGLDGWPANTDRLTIQPPAGSSPEDVALGKPTTFSHELADRARHLPATVARGGRDVPLVHPRDAQRSHTECSVGS